MRIRILGQHTAKYGDFPYDKGCEFESALREQWDAISWFRFDCIDQAEIQLDPSRIQAMTVRSVYTRLAKVVKRAAQVVDWDIWEVPVLTAKGVVYGRLLLRRA